jgi:hypothetical protein
MRQCLRIAAAELQGHRLFGRIETQEPVAVAAQHGAGGQHLGIQERPARQQPMEKPAMPVGPFHHRGDGEVSFQHAAFVALSHLQRPSRGHPAIKR